MDTLLRERESRRRLDELVEGPEHRGWHEVVVDARSGENEPMRPTPPLTS
jgi:hypothetical protein